MQGGDSTHPDRASLVKNSEDKNPRLGDVDSLSSEWTDEKHNLYLSSIEATFVNQLYSSKHLSSDLMSWLSRTQKKANPSQSNLNEQQSGQFKVMCQGSWGNLKFERAKSKEANENESCYVLANPWIQHFKSPSIAKHPLTSVNMDKNDFLCQSINLNSQMEVKNTCSKHLPVCNSLMYHQDPVSSRAEVSDQNFVDTEYKLGKEPNKASSKKRSRQTSHSKINDQIVPCNSFSAYSSKSGNFPKERDVEISNTIEQQNIDGSSYYNEREIEGLRFIKEDLQTSIGTGGENISGG